MDYNDGLQVGVVIEVLRRVPKGAPFRGRIPNKRRTGGFRLSFSEPPFRCSNTRQCHYRHTWTLAPKPKDLPSVSFTSRGIGGIKKKRGRPKSKIDLSSNSTTF